ncbi:alpha/beta hydrolase fold-domain-containing protein [Gautieria morchelliformis]|nr:alpha/beta hydrolase fold-domain-containing protein [Gautieria morchelliformis]
MTNSSEAAVDPLHNALLPQFEAQLSSEYVALYNKHILGRKLAHEFDIEDVRKNPVILGFGEEQGPEIGTIEEINIPVDGGEITLRIYRPTAEQATISAQGGRLPPVHLNFHGGGWVIGTIGNDESWIRRAIAATGCVVVDVNYRLAPEYRFPIPIEDSWAALVYVSQHGATLGVDTSRISLGGWSAGGHLSAVLSHRARDMGLEGIVFVLMAIPVVDASAIGTDLQVHEDTPHKSWIDCHDCPFLSHARMSWFYKHFLPLPITSAVLRNPLVSPLLAGNFKGLPPTLVYPAEIDVLRDEGLAYAKRLKEDGDGWVECVLAKGVPHPFVHQTAATPRAWELVEKSTSRMKEAYAGLLKR